MLTEKRKREREWIAANTKNYHVAFTIATGVPDALDKAAKEKGITAVKYIKTAVIEKLFDCGFVDSPHESSFDLNEAKHAEAEKRRAKKE